MTIAVGDIMSRRSRQPRPDLVERNRAGHEHPIFPAGEDSGIKHCTGCCNDKPLKEFARDAKAPGGKRANCARCAANAAQTHYHHNGGREKQRLRRAELVAARQERVGAIKDVPCADCGGRFPAICMDFDHVRGAKVGNISGMIRKAFSWELILVEIEKCEVVCSNCHRIRTAKRGQYGSATSVGRAV